MSPILPLLCSIVADKFCRPWIIPLPSNCGWAFTLENVLPESSEPPIHAIVSLVILVRTEYVTMRYELVCSLLVISNRIFPVRSATIPRTVNTTSRHESSGEAGKVHCSITTQAELTSRYPELFGLEKRGQVYMKGKGEQTTYWLTSQDNNPLVNTAALEELDVEVRTILAKSQFQNEKDFEKQVVRRNGGCQVTREVRTLRKFRRILSQTISTSSANLVEVSSTSSGSDTSSSEDGERVAKQDDVDLGPLVRRGSSLQLLEASADMFKQQNSHSRAVAGPEENTTSLKRKAISGQEGMELGTAWDSILQKQ